MAELRAELKRLKGLEKQPDRVEPVPVGETYAQRWQRLSPAERGAWLRSSDVKIHASRDPGAVLNLLAQDTGSGFGRGVVRAGNAYAALIISSMTSH